MVPLLGVLLPREKLGVDLLVHAALYGTDQIKQHLSPVPVGDLGQAATFLLEPKEAECME